MKAECAYYVYLKSLDRMWRDYTKGSTRWLTLLWNIKGGLSLNLDKILQQARLFQVKLSEQVSLKANYPLLDNQIFKHVKNIIFNVSENCEMVFTLLFGPIRLLFRFKNYFILYKEQQ